MNEKRRFSILKERRREALMLHRQTIGVEGMGSAVDVENCRIFLILLQMLKEPILLWL